MVTEASAEMLQKLLLSERKIILCWIVSKKNKWFYFGLTIPSMLLYVLALAGPLLLGTLPASFYNWNLIKGNKDFVGLGNYTKLLGDETFIHSVVFTLILAVISILMSNLIGFVIAYFLDSNVRCKGVIRSLFLFLILSVV